MDLGVIREPLDKTGCGRDVGRDGAAGGGKTAVLTSLRIKTVTGRPPRLKTYSCNSPALSGYNTAKLSMITSFKTVIRDPTLLLSVMLTWDGRSEAHVPLTQSTMSSF
jgi:hypothetical protein